MNEIEKMYKLVQPEKRCDTYGTFGQCPHKTWKCKECTSFVYRPFTAEKQLELIKLFAVWEISITRILDAWYISVDGLKKNIKSKGDFSEAIAKYINFNWQDLTEEEKQQVKGILE